MYKLRPDFTLHQHGRRMIQITTEGFDVPLKENWSKRWCTLPGDFAYIYDSIYNFEVYDDDIFVITFPKSGTTWLQEAAWLLLNNLDYAKAQEVDLHERSVFMDLTAIYNDILPRNTVQLAAQLSRPRLIKSHLPAHLLPQQIWKKKAKIIYCARNLKDVAVSYYHFHTGLGTWKGSMDDFVRDLIYDNIMYAPYWPHVLDFWLLRDRPDIFFTTYEAMQRDLKEVLFKLNRFLGKPDLEDLELNKLVKHLSFQNMKENKKTNPSDTIKSGHDRVHRNFEFMRRGIIGAFRDELSPENQSQLDEFTRSVLEAHKISERHIFGELMK